MNYPTPIGSKLLIEPIDGEEKKYGDIVIPDVYQDGESRGIVRRLGTGKRNKDGKDIPWRVAVDDVVILPKQGAVRIKVGQKKMIMLDEDLVLAVED